MYIIIFLFTAFRDSIGVDTKTYQTIYKEFIQDASSNPQIEVGYKYLNIFTHEILNSYALLQCIVFGICLYLIHVFFKSTIPSKLEGCGLVALICSLLYLDYLCSGVRQGLAVCFCLCSCVYLLKRQYKKYLFLILVATLFHKSALLFLFAYFIPRKTFKFKYIFLLLIISYLGAPIVKMIFDNVIGMVTGHYMGYASMMNGDANSNSGMGILVRLTIWINTLIFGKLAIQNRYKDYGLFYNCFLLGVTLYLLNRNVDILNRFNEYFLSFFIIIFPLSLLSFKNYSKIVYFLGLGVLLVAIFLSFILFVKDSFIPYKSYLAIL